MSKLLSFVIWTLSFVWHLSFVICHCPRKGIATPRQVGAKNLIVLRTGFPSNLKRLPRLWLAMTLMIWYPLPRREGVRVRVNSANFPPPARGGRILFKGSTRLFKKCLRREPNQREPHTTKGSRFDKRRFE